MQGHYRQFNQRLLPRGSLTDQNPLKSFLRMFRLQGLQASNERDSYFHSDSRNTKTGRLREGGLRKMFSNRESGSDVFKHCIFLPHKPGDFFWWGLKSVVSLLLVASFVLVSYLAIYNQSQWKCNHARHSVPFPVALPPEDPSDSPPAAKTNISHILFGIGGSVQRWPSHSRYSQLWWKPGRTRGFVWLDREPPDGAAWPADWIPYRVSGDSSRFKYTCRYGSRSAVRIARIVAESVRLGAEGVRWYVMGDDDTVFFTENLVEVLGKYDHQEFRYVGGVSESVEQDVLHSYGMAYGGGGFAISSALAQELARALDGCLDRYASFYGSDQRVHACLSEIGVPLTREPGFHQVDLRGDAYGLLAAHPVAPIVSLHHLDGLKPLIPTLSQLDALGKVLDASRADPGRALQQTFCYDTRRNWSVSVAWGYTVQIYPWILTAKELQTPLRTFQTWRSHKPEPFTFNTRPWSLDACENPVVYFLDGVDGVGRVQTRTAYTRRRSSDPGVECNRAHFKPALKVQKVEVVAPKMPSDEWTKAPRRQCCDVQTKDGRKRGRLHVTIRKCRVGESLSPP